MYIFELYAKTAIWSHEKQIFTKLPWWSGNAPDFQVEVGGSSPLLLHLFTGYNLVAWRRKKSFWAEIAQWLHGWIENLSPGFDSEKAPTLQIINHAQHTARRSLPLDGPDSGS